MTVGDAAAATWTATDPLSGVAGAAEGAIALDTSRSGTFTASREIADNVGHVATLSCEYRVDEPAESPDPTASPAASPTPSAGPALQPAPTPQPAPQPAPQPIPQPAATANAPEPTVALAPRRRRPITAGGRLRLSVSCTGGECDGRVVDVRSGRRAPFRIAEGGEATVVLQLTRRERRALARRGRLALRLSVRLIGATEAATHTLTVTRTRRPAR